MTKCKICGTETDMPFHSCSVPVNLTELREKIAKLESEHGEARRQRDEVLNIPEEWAKITDYVLEMRSLRAELAKEKARLDWLEANRKPLIPYFGLQPPIGSGLPIPFEGYTLDYADPHPKPVRAAIDAAMNSK